MPLLSNLQSPLTLFLALSLSLSLSLPPAALAQGNCTTDDFTAGAAGWTATTGSYVAGVGFTTGATNAISLHKALTGVESFTIYYSTSHNVTVQANRDGYNFGSGAGSPPGGSVTYSPSAPDGDFSIVVISSVYPTDSTITGVEACGLAGTPAPPTATPVPAPTATPYMPGSGEISAQEAPPALPTPNLPYHFEPIAVNPNAAPSLPLPSVYTPDFINALGSYALTVFTLLDQWNVLGVVVVIMLGLSALWWLYSFVTGRPITPTLNLFGGVETYVDATATYQNHQLESEAQRYEAMVEEYDNYLKRQSNYALGPGKEFMDNLTRGADMARGRAKSRRDAIAFNEGKHAQFDRNFGKFKRLYRSRPRF